MTNTYCVYAVLRYSWWWSVDLSETCRIRYQINLRNSASRWLSLWEWIKQDGKQMVLVYRTKTGSVNTVLIFWFAWFRSWHVNIDWKLAAVSRSILHVQLFAFFHTHFLSPLLAFPWRSIRHFPLILQHATNYATYTYSYYTWWHNYYWDIWGCPSGTEKH